MSHLRKTHKINARHHRQQASLLPEKGKTAQARRQLTAPRRQVQVSPCSCVKRHDMIILMCYQRKTALWGCKSRGGLRYNAPVIWRKF